MRCSEAKARLIEQNGELTLDNQSSELSKHIATCQSCSREAKALGLLTTAFKNLRDEKIEADIPIGAMRSRLNNSVNPKSRTTQRVVFPAIAVALAVLLITFWPATKQSQLEYSVAISGIERELAEDSDFICDLLMNIGLSNADIKQVECQLTCEIEVVHLQSKSEIDLLVKALAQINSINLETDIKTIRIENGV